MAEMTADTKDKLQKLWDNFAVQLPNMINRIRETWDTVQGLGGDSAEMKQFVLMLHSLAGSAPSFGFTAVGSAAREMETALKGMEGNSPPSQALKNRIGTRLRELAAATGSRVEQGAVQGGVLQVGTRRDSSEKTNRLVFIVDDDAALAEHLAVQIGCFGYEVRFFSDLVGLKKALLLSSPAVIIADMSFPEGDFAGAQAIMELRREDCADIPVIFISQRNLLEARIKAVQAGGEAYFLKPVPMSELIEKLDALAFGTAREPYRVLIVDDDVELSELHATILQGQGMITRVVNDPMQILKHMVGFRPDLVLLDFYMPGCNGHELARAIRQIEDYDGIPIVFLSAETSIDRQLDAIRMGGDEFLTKPVRPELLISSVNIRAERMRIVRTFMARDSLTGLLNLVKTQEQLELALLRAKKNNTPCSYALIELDDFQAVNDKHGYLTGDRVIVITALLLKRRVRAADVVGRFGGHKFAVIMPDTDAETAFAILDEIRASFARILHECHHGEFYLTLSGGIAVYPQSRDVVALNREAGLALAEARGKGRNRIEAPGR
ncbi:MAG: response regulator [Deltaproteobacteria bacterium]|nr:response regulator [Deltaproteobacteria bacterium]